MPKNRHPLAAFVPLIAFTTLACPTRPAPGADGAGGARIGGQSGSLGTDASAGAASVRSGVAGAAGGEAGTAAGAAGAGSPGGTTGEGGHAQAGAAGGAAGTVGGSGGAAGGGCSSACGPTATCVGSACLLNDGQQCSLASQCVSAVCTPFYQDVDGDGYGTGPAVGFCGTATPVGYAAQTGDCCDNAANLALAKLIHPKAGFQTVSAGGVCGVTWDYDCDGTIETSLSNGECDPNAVYPSCAPLFVNYPESACGTTQSDYTCMGETVPNSSGPGTMNVCAGADNGGPQTLGCK